MSLVNLPHGIPALPRDLITTSTSQTVTALDAAGELIAFIGRVHWLSGTSKTISAAGAGKLLFRTGTSVTWATAGSTLRVGLQDVDLANTTTPSRPDGVYDVYGERVQGTDALAGGTYYEQAMSSGTKTLSNSDYVCVVIELTVKNGADLVNIARNTSDSDIVPNSSAYLSAAWSAAGGTTCGLIADDGTRGILENLAPSTAPSVLAFQSGDAYPEYGNVLQLPYRHQVSGVWATMFATAASLAADFDARLYTDPTGTPVQQASTSVDASIFRNMTGGIYIPFSSAVTIEANTPYAVSFRATTAADVRMTKREFAAAAWADFYAPGGAGTLYAAKRAAGAFVDAGTSKDTLVVISPMISAIDDGAGAGGGLAMPVSGRICA